MLPNIWDAASATSVVAAGFGVVATSSGAVAATLGYADHEGAPADEMFAALARICRVVDVPVTADLEAGYHLAADELVARLLEAGAVGCNIEDTDHRAGARVDPQAQAERLAAIRGAAQVAGVDVVLNARIDSWLHPGEERDRLHDARQRADLYRAAGADCVYPIGLADHDTIAQFVGETDAPVNVLWPLGGAPLDAAAALGVARVSYGTRLFGQQMAALRQLAIGLAAQVG